MDEGTQKTALAPAKAGYGAILHKDLMVPQARAHCNWGRAVLVPTSMLVCGGTSQADALDYHCLQAVPATVGIPSEALLLSLTPMHRISLSSLALRQVPGFSWVNQGKIPATPFMSSIRHRLL